MTDFAKEARDTLERIERIGAEPMSAVGPTRRERQLFTVGVFARRMHAAGLAEAAEIARGLRTNGQGDWNDGYDTACESVAEAILAAAPPT